MDRIPLFTLFSAPASFLLVKKREQRTNCARQGQNDNILDCTTNKAFVHIRRLNPRSVLTGPAPKRAATTHDEWSPRHPEGKQSMLAQNLGQPLQRARLLHLPRDGGPHSSTSTSHLHRVKTVRGIPEIILGTCACILLATDLAMLGWSSCFMISISLRRNSYCSTVSTSFSSIV